ncbi:MAG: TonB family protein [Sphingomonas sp.]
MRRCIITGSRHRPAWRDGGRHDCRSIGSFQFASAQPGRGARGQRRRRRRADLLPRAAARRAGPAADLHRRSDTASPGSAADRAAQDRTAAASRADLCPADRDPAARRGPDHHHRYAAAVHTPDRSGIDRHRRPRRRSAQAGAAADRRRDRPALRRRFSAAISGPELRAQREGTATVRVHIGADGRVVAVEQVRATSAAFFEATRRQALAKWRFRPASRGGIAEDSWRTMTVHFVLTDG